MTILGYIGAAFGCWVLWILWKYRNVNAVGEMPLVKIILQNQAEQLEGLVRWLCRRHPDVRLVLVDVGSTDDTPAILRRLSVRYGFCFETEGKRYNPAGVE
ncbi:hypothetical protein V6C27_01730 [Peptococcaceae bacterium 1198_IL3148]